MKISSVQSSPMGRKRAVPWSSPEVQGSDSPGVRASGTEFSDGLNSQLVRGLERQKCDFLQIPHIIPRTPRTSKQRCGLLESLPLLPSLSSPPFLPLTYFPGALKLRTAKKNESPDGSSLGDHQEAPCRHSNIELHRVQLFILCI